MNKAVPRNEGRPRWRLMAASVAALFLMTACADIRIENRHGYMPDQTMIEKVRPGVHDTTSVRRLLGSPATEANFNGRTWVYITKHTKRVAFLPEETVEQKVLTVKFDKAGLVKGLKQYTLADGKKIEIAEDKTPTHGSELTVMQQLLGNLGRFNTQLQEDQ